MNNIHFYKEEVTYIFVYPVNRLTLYWYVRPMKLTLTSSIVYLSLGFEAAQNIVTTSIKQNKRLKVSVKN